MKKVYEFIYRKVVVEPRIKAYLFHHLKDEDKVWLYKWHSTGNVLKKSDKLRYYDTPVYSWIQGIKGKGDISKLLAQGQSQGKE